MLTLTVIYQASGGKVQGDLEENEVVGDQYSSVVSTCSNKAL